jgi:hypothetical protein
MWDEWARFVDRATPADDPMIVREGLNVLRASTLQLQKMIRRLDNIASRFDNDDCRRVA